MVRSLWLSLVMPVMVKFGDISPAEYQGCYSHALHLAVCDVLYKENGPFDNVASKNTDI